VRKSRPASLWRGPKKGKLLRGDTPSTKGLRTKGNVEEIRRLYWGGEKNSRKPETKTTDFIK